MSKADIEVNGKRYSVACAPGQEDRLAALGVLLDKRIRHIADAVGDLGEARLLLVAALALLDELEVLKKTEALAAAPVNDDKAIAALVDAAARIDAIASRLNDATSRTH